jgi:DNA-binding HxlR family transcriptional regulator
MGETLLQAVTSILEWANAHLAEIDAARTHYDARLGLGALPVTGKS